MSSIYTAKFVELAIRTAKRSSSFKTAIIIGCIIEAAKLPTSTVFTTVAVLCVILTAEGWVEAVFTALKFLINYEI